MKTVAVEIGKYEAQAQYQVYRKLCRARFDGQTPEVRKRLLKEHSAAQRVLWHAARGRKIIKVRESIQAAGVDGHGWPKLAFDRADRAFSYCRRLREGRPIIVFGQVNDWGFERRTASFISAEINDCAVGQSPVTRVLRAVVPTIPSHLVPAGRLSNYHILWEAEWTPIAPKDPILVQHIDGDCYAVLAQWDLTEVERAVLSGRFIE